MKTVIIVVVAVAAWVLAAGLCWALVAGATKHDRQEGEK